MYVPETECVLWKTKIKELTTNVDTSMANKDS